MTEAGEDMMTLRLLVVEDEALVAMLIEDALALHGHHVTGVADTAQQAIEMARRDPPDLALCDVKLADGDSGILAAQMLAESGVTCLFLSGNCPPSSPHPRIVGCLPKPFHTASIDAAIAVAHALAYGRRPERIPAGMTLY